MKRIILLTIVLPLFALPQIKEVASGTAQVDRKDPSHLRITASDKAIINYDSFNIGQDEQITFVQPKANSAVLNRVKGKDPSSLMGRLNANGRVFLINPNGIVIGPSGSINTASFIASSLDISDNDFLNDRFQFSLRPNSETVVNHGTISCPEGAVALLAPQVQNKGAILAKADKVILASGDKITLDFSGDGLMSFSVEDDVKKAAIEQLDNTQQVFLKLNVADEALKRVVNTDGLEVATQMIEANGVFRLASKSFLAVDPKTPHFVGPKFYFPGVYDTFGFTLAADFFFQQDRAADCKTNCPCDNNVYDFIHEPDSQCMYNKMFWNGP